LVPTKPANVDKIHKKTAQYVIFTYHWGMSDTKERAVQTYLAFLENPETVDRMLIARLENQFPAADSPIAKLRLLAEIDRARTSERLALEEGFVRHASSWAAENKIPPSAFLALGVDPEILVRAGFEPETGPGWLAGATGVSKRTKDSAKRSGRFPTRNNRKPRAKSVTSHAVEELVLATTEPFSIRDIVELSHATNATVSRVVGCLVAAQKVEKIGVLTPQGTRGASPLGYRVKKAAPLTKARKNT
jgi:hypothetical protein